MSDQTDAHDDTGPGTEDPGPATAASALEALVRRVDGVSRRPRRSFEAPRMPRWLALLVVLTAAGVGFLGWRWVARPAPIEERMPVAGATVGGGAPGAAAGGSADVGPTVADPGAPAGSGGVTVHVAGAVERPGVVSLPEGSRVGDAIGEAGGLTAVADADRLNLAARLGDGARVFVPVVGQEIPIEVPTGSGGRDSEASASAPLDLNSADSAALEDLPGVGPATAEAILAHREEIGRFSSVEELLDVRGIGEAKLDAIADLVTVG